MDGRRPAVAPVPAIDISAPRGPVEAGGATRACGTLQVDTAGPASYVGKQDVGAALRSG